MRTLNPFLTVLDNGFLQEIELLFAALNINCEIEKKTIYLKSEDIDFVYKNLNEYLAEEIKEIDTSKDTPVNILFSYFLIFGLFVFYFFTKSTNFNYWVRIGGNDANKVINGEFYRALTSLTLHNDILHICSNILFFLILIKPVVKILKDGKTWFFILLAGFTGNVFSDYIYQAYHTSIGFSTSVFAVIGMLSFINFTINKEETFFVKKYLPFAAGIALLSITGMGKNVDMAAHISGFFSGIVVLMLYKKKKDFFDKFNDNVYKTVVLFVFVISWLFAVVV